MHLTESDRQLLRVVAVLFAAFLAIQVFALVWQAVGAVADVLLVFIAAWAVSYLLAPLVRRIDDRTPLDRTLSVVAVYIVIAVLLAAAGALVVPPLSQQLSDMIARAPEYGDRAGQAVINAQNTLASAGVKVDLADLYGTLPQRVGAIAGAYAADILGVISATAGVLFNLTLVLIIAFLMLIDGDALWRRLLMRLPPSRRHEAEMFREAADRSFGGFIRGSLILGTIYAIATYIILTFFSVPFAGVLSVVSGLTMIIPFFGPIIAMVPVLGVTAVGAGDRLLWVFIALLVLQQIVLNVVGPRIMSRSIGIHPLFVFFALLLGARVAGFWGVVLAMPIAGILNVFAHYLWDVTIGRPGESEHLVEAS
ncbi:MAG TPA: AI-2E family transporter [Candidatus Limnocylindria bacterium]|nr:AI-2E family transporter [Candidatus Limnocylindria bacterium]